MTTKLLKMSSETGIKEEHAVTIVIEGAITTTITQ
jgi:hypothetical protein